MNDKILNNILNILVANKPTIEERINVVLEVNKPTIEERVDTVNAGNVCSFDTVLYNEETVFFSSLIKAYKQNRDLFTLIVREFFKKNFNIIITAVWEKFTELCIVGLIPSNIKKILGFSKFDNSVYGLTAYGLTSISSYLEDIDLLSNDKENYVNNDAVYLFKYLYKEVNPDLFEDRLGTLLSLAKINSKTYDYIFNNIIDNDEDKLIFTVLK